MGSIKRYIEAAEAEEAMNEWISNHVDLGVEEGDPEWEEAKLEYLSGAALEPEWMYDDFALELERLTGDDQAFASFSKQMTDLESELPDLPSDALLKMTYSYSVTLMETCLGDMIKSVVLSEEHYLKNAIKNVDELKDIKLSLMDVYSDNDIVKKIVLITLSEFLYHNIAKIVPVYSAVLGEKPPENVKNNMRTVILITLIRHDIVHRNGVDKDGQPVELNKAVVLQAMNDIHNFVNHMKKFIDAVWFNRNAIP